MMNDYANEQFIYKQDKQIIYKQDVIDAMYGLCKVGTFKDNPHIDDIINAIENISPVTIDVAIKIHRENEV